MSKTGLFPEEESLLPHLSVNLDDAADCRRGMRFLRRHLRTGHGDCGDGGAESRGVVDSKSAWPLKKKLAVIKQRGVWRHLVAIAKEGDVPRSLPEWDARLDLPRNKMRSLKAIFAKLENRWDVRFLKPAPDAGNDEAGNPRYIMPARIRAQILSIAD